MAEKGKNKNQTAVERKTRNAELADRPTRRLCAADNCPTPRQGIVQRDLVAVREYRGGKGRMRYYHKTCR